MTTRRQDLESTHRRIYNVLHTKPSLWIRLVRFLRGLL